MRKNTIKMNQSRYIETISSKFGMADCKPHLTPCEMDIKKTSYKVDLIESKPYCKIIGSLIVANNYWQSNGCNKTRHLLYSY